MRFGASLGESVRSQLAIATLLLLALAGGVAGQSATSAAAGVNPTLEPGDLVRLKIWREPDLSGDFRVDESGSAVFPKLGTVEVARMSTDSLKSLLVTGYSRYLQNPAVEVVFLRRVNVLGEVNRPGLYHVEPSMTVADVLALAGGVNPDGNPGKIELIRQGRRLRGRLSPRSSLIESSLRSGDQLRVPLRSWLSRNTGVIGAGMTAIALVATAVIRR